MNEPKFRVNTKMTEELYRYSNKGFQKETMPPGSWTVWALVFMMLVGNACGAYVLQGFPRWICIIVCAAFAVIAGFMIWGTCRKNFALGRAYRKIVKQMEGNLSQSYEFYPDALVISRWYIKETVSYDFISWVLEFPKGYMIVLKNCAVYYFWKQEISGGTADEFRQFLESAAGQKTKYVEIKG